jgi:hypothetical protein
MEKRQLEAALSLLIADMEGEQGDSHEIYLKLRQILASMGAMGMPLPDDLVRMEREMSAEFEAEATQARN